MAENRDPLDAVFTNEDEIDKALLANLLQPFVRINVAKRAIWFWNAGSKLPMADKILLFFLARKALRLRDNAVSDEIAPSELIKETGFKEGTVHPTLKQLREHGLLVARAGKYFVPNYKLADLKTRFKLGV